MNDAWIPDGLGVMQPIWKNWFENALAVQFNHRLLAYVVLLLAAANALWLRTTTATVLLIAVLCQAHLGHSHSFMASAAVHRSCPSGRALVVLALALWHVVSIMRVPVPDRQ